ncbi:MAG TPA: ABC transporter ATP-binding protein [Streptosporangiaceae bacterium]|jgi:oligopeptide/dipeptide ABC transporter ATP-binding protein|nr:ABC transporter ATP-binding protein [Streptosporangiaceae bacterium]
MTRANPQRPIPPEPILRAKGLNVVYEPARGARIWPVRDVSLELAEGEFAGLVGESGCGKSTLGYALTRMLRPPAKLESGSIWFGGTDITALEGEELRRHRRGGFALVLQSGMNALNPVRTVEGHFADVFRAHRRAGPHATLAQELLDRVHLPAATLRRYPHELSGGMRQRVAIAVALALGPRLVVFDEPTTALDVIVQGAVMDTIRELQRDAGFTALLISHDLGLVLEATDRVLVMYAGRIVEDRPSAGLTGDPGAGGARHPYTRALLRCYGDPRADEVHIEGIPGSPPDLSQPPGGCPYVPRCPLAEPVCGQSDPDLTRRGNGATACHVAAREAEPAKDHDAG